MAKIKRNEAQAARTLAEGYARYRLELGHYPWESESDRWTELLVCALTEGAQCSAADARAAVESLNALNLTDAKELATATDGKRVLIEQILARVLDDGSAKNTTSSAAAAMLTRIARVAIEKWDGHIQRFLRRHGEAMVTDLAAILTAKDLPAPRAAKVATVWLQNVANLPVLHQKDPHLHAFRLSHKMTEAELLDLADRLDLGVAVLDDVLAFAQGGVSRGPIRGKGKRLQRQTEA
jgi:hypothetical protein